MPTLPPFIPSIYSAKFEDNYQLFSCGNNIDYSVLANYYNKSQEISQAINPDILEPDDLRRKGLEHITTKSLSAQNIQQNLSRFVQFDVQEVPPELQKESIKVRTGVLIYRAVFAISQFLSIDQQQNQRPNWANITFKPLIIELSKGFQLLSRATVP